MLQIKKSSLLYSSLWGLWISLDQSKASIQVTWSVLTNQRPVLLYKKLLYCDKSDFTTQQSAQCKWKCVSEEKNSLDRNLQLKVKMSYRKSACHEIQKVIIVLLLAQFVENYWMVNCIPIPYDKSFIYLVK